MTSQENHHDAAMRFLLGRIDYERTATMPYRARDFKLDRMRNLLARLDNPQDRLPILHIAGTKGKGSTAAMMAAILKAARYRTGMFSSPHFERVEERLAINGKPCSAAELVELVAEVRPVVEAMDHEAAAAGGMGPTYFEIITALALVHFVRRRVDAAVLEVGLGGRLDSTNVCIPRVCVITSISLDHTEQLGDTLEAIAREKAGIVKPGVPVVSGVLAPGPRSVIAEVCREQVAPLLELGVDFTFDYRPAEHLEQSDAPARLDFRWQRPPAGFVPAEYVDLALPLAGRHQAANAALALAALAPLQQFDRGIDDRAVRRGLADLHWPGRVEVLGRRPAVVVDVAHNVASIEALLETLEESFHARRRHLVFAASNDKDIRGMLQALLPRFDTVALTRYTSNPRSAAPEELARLAHELSGQRPPAFTEPAAAWHAAKAQAEPDDLICVTGSFFIAAEVRRLFTAK